MIEQTLTFVRKSHLDRADAMLGEIGLFGSMIKRVLVESVPESFIRDHYAEHDGKFFFPWILDYHVGFPLLLAVFEGEDIVRRTVDLVGATDPAKALPFTLRARYCTDSQEIAMAEERFVENGIHRSADVLAARREIYGVWQPFLNL